MLPSKLHGPGKVVHFEPPDAFLAENASRFPNLDPDFILQICFEHPDRFDDLFPRFDPAVHDAVRVTRTAGWVYDNVRYDDDEEPDFWSIQFDDYLRNGESAYSVFAHMVKNRTWPFPPVIIEASFAVELGASGRLGKPYYLNEGTHRVSYMRRMVQLGMVSREEGAEVIEVRLGSASGRSPGEAAGREA